MFGMFLLFSSNLFLANFNFVKETKEKKNYINDDV